MFTEDTELPKKAKSKEMGPIMFLSLFLLLLAFFILLNTLSTFEEAKARQVIKSVTSTFKTELDEKTKAQIFVSTLGAVPDAKEVMESIETLWVTAVPLTKVESLQDGSMMQLSMHVNDLFVGGAIAMRNDRKNLLKAVSSALSARIEDSTIEMEFLMGVEALERIKTTAPQNVSPTNIEVPAYDVNPEEIDLAEFDEDSRALAFARVSTVANKFSEAGAPPSAITIGLRHADPKQLRIRFYVHPNESAYINFNNLVPANDGAIVPSRVEDSL